MSALGVTDRTIVEVNPVMLTDVPALDEAGEQELALMVVLDETVNVTSATYPGILPVGTRPLESVRQSLPDVPAVQFAGV